MSRINVTQSSMPTIEEYIEELKPVWDSRWLSNRGAASIKFEEKLKEYLGVEDVYCFANGHLALECVLQGLRENLVGTNKKEIITTPYTHVSTTHAIVRNGFRPIFVDVLEESCAINPDMIEATITENTVAIVATHVYGFPCDVEKIEAIAQKHKLVVIYDAAHAFGVKYKGVGIGNFGDAAMFSTHATKVFHTIEGGLVTYKTDASSKFKNLKESVNFGFISPEDVICVGTNARMNEFECVMGIVNLKHIDHEITKRRKVAERYWERLSHIDGIKSFAPEKNVEWNYSYMPFLFDGAGKNRNNIQDALKKNDVYARKYFFPLVTEMSCYKNQFKGDLPIAKYISEHVLTLPLYADLELEDVDRICDIIIG